MAATTTTTAAALFLAIASSHEKLSNLLEALPNYLSTSLCAQLVEKDTRESVDIYKNHQLPILGLGHPPAERSTTSTISKSKCRLWLVFAVSGFDKD